MGLTIGTNIAAMENNQQLNKLANKRTENQNEISTGKAVNSFKTAAAALSIANRMTADSLAYEAAQTGQGLAEATAGVAQAAGQQVNDLLTDARAKAVLASTGGLSDADKQAIQGEVDQLLSQVDTTVSSASFNDINLVDSQNGQGGQSFVAAASIDGSESIELDAPAFDRTALGLNAVDVVGDPAGALTSIDDALAQVAAGNADIAAFSNSLATSGEAISNQIDAITQGVGALVDADMGRAAAVQSSLEVRNQLQTTTSSIANAAPSVIGQLF